MFILAGGISECCVCLLDWMGVFATQIRIICKFVTFEGDADYINKRIIFYKMVLYDYVEWCFLNEELI